MSSLSSSSRSTPTYSYDVFLSFRGEDTRKTFVDHLYSALKQHLINIYKDDETLLRGESIRPSLLKAIEESQIAVIIFSKNYADSAWCLDELAYIMKCKEERGLVVMPIFYDVEPSEVRNQKRKFGEAFAKQEAKNATRAEIWRKTLVDVTNIAGWELKHIANGHESQFIKRIVDAILDRLFMLNTRVDEDFVGMRARFEDLESLLDIRSSGVRMVGIWGIGGSGKTTLATSVCMEIFHHFQAYCILENVREESKKYGLKKLQETILSVFFKTEVKVNSVVEGKHKIKNMLRSKSVLMILDDVNNIDQLEALAGKHDWFGKGSRIIIITRDEHLLRTHKVDQIYPVRLLSDDEAIQLFKRHAYDVQHPVEDYETLSLRVVSYAAGLPMALKVLGSFLYDKDKKGWMSTLARLKDIPEMEIMEKLKISYDGLKPAEKELFLDIACFFRREYTYEAMEILEACGFHPGIGIEVSRQKALITIVNDRFGGSTFDMHDLVEEMGHYIIRREHPKNPEKHSRVWKQEEIEDMCFGDATMENDQIEVIKYNGSLYGDPSYFCKIISNMKKLRWLWVTTICNDYDEGPTFLSDELRYIKWDWYPSRSPFPDSFRPIKLVVLKLSFTMQRELWKGCKHLPHLKVLQLHHMKKLLTTPDFDGLPCLQKLTLWYCGKLEEIHPSLGNHTSLRYLCVSGCRRLLELPKLPSSLAIVKADFCGSLKVVADVHKSCKWLCQVSFTKGTITNDGEKLLQCMLEGYAIESGSMILQLDGVEVAKGFLPLLVKGRTLRLQLPENWRNEFCGLLMCVVFRKDMDTSVWISMFGMDSEDDLPWEESDSDPQDDVVWEESRCDDFRSNCTWVGYVSFSSLRLTVWWDQTYKRDQTYKFLSLSIGNKNCTGFGVRLIGKKSKSGLMKKSTASSHYTPKFKIKDDSVTGLEFVLSFYKFL